MNLKVSLQAHRGVNSECPENTMAAFRTAIAQGYDYIELDPNYTSDGQIVVLHDATINRTGRFLDGSIIPETVRIADITYQEALRYDFGSCFSPKYRGEKIPLLSDVLSLAKENGIRVKIDNKIENFSERIKENLYRLLEEYEEILALTTAHEEMIPFYAKRFPNAEIHYDGIVDQTIMTRLGVYGKRLTIWLPYQSELTDWVKVPFVDEELAKNVHLTSRLGIWLIDDSKSFETVCKMYSPDIVETKGRIKPSPCCVSICDLHTHSQNSHDSQCPVNEMAEAEIEKGISAFAVTDHCDILYYDTVDISEVMDSSHRETLENAKAFENRVKILTGLELGEGIWNEEYSQEILQAYPYDVVLGSVHTVRFEDASIPYSRIDFSEWKEERLKAYIHVYFDEVMEMLHTLPIDVLTHLTCPFSYINGKFHRNLNTKEFQEPIRRILQYIIDRGIALEVNTSKVNTDYGQYMPDEWILREYHEMGGTLLTLGSDAHISANAANAFQQTLQMLKNIGFEHGYTFANRIAIPCW